MATGDSKRGGARHTLTVGPGATRGIHGEGERFRTGVTYRSERVWGCTHVTPVAGGADAEVTDHV